MSIRLTRRAALAGSAAAGAVSLANAADRLQITLVELDKTSP